MKRTDFEQHIGNFITFLDVEKHASSHTLSSYRSDLEQLAAFWKRIDEQEPGVLHTFERIVQRYVVSLFYKKISKPSLARKISSLRSLQAFLAKQGITLNFTVKSPQLDKKLPDTLTVDEIFYLLDDISPESLPTKYPQRDKAILELLYATGVRCSELIAIKLSDIDFYERTILIHGKGNKERIVLFGKKALQQLEAYIMHERNRLVPDPKEQALFVNRLGEKLTARSIQRIIEMFRQHLKIRRRITPHKIRHSFATHLLNQGVNLRIIQELLGHTSITSTEIYTQISNRQLAKLCDEKHPLNAINLFEEEEEKVK